MARFVAALVVCGLLATASALPRIHRKVYSNRIVGGEPVVQGELPYQISLRHDGNLHCGGSIVVVNNKQVIVTAAHCVDSTSPRPLTVVCGNIDREDTQNSQTRQVIRIIYHEHYDAWSAANDIAVLYIHAPFEVNENCAPIALPTQQQPTTGDVIISGWGTLEYNGDTLPSILRKVQIPIVADDVCQQLYWKENILPSMLCAGVLPQGGKDSCQGDSGGPVRAVNGGYLAGVVSWAYGCASPNYPGVNTEVSHYIDWLEANVQ